MVKKWGLINLMDQKFALLVFALIAIVAFVGIAIFIVSPNNLLKSPAQVCAEKGMLYDAQTQQCIVCSHVGQGCAFSQCCMGLSCDWDVLAPLNLFRSCQGTQVYGGV